MASDEEMLDVNFPPDKTHYMSLTPVHHSLTDSSKSDRDHAPMLTPAAVEAYDEYDTIDWVKDLSADSNRKRLLQQKAEYSCVGGLQLLWDSSSGWLCVGLIGALVGFLAAVMDIGVSWLSDLKEGICMEQLWFNREQCCWSYNMTVASPLFSSSPSKPTAVQQSPTGSTTTTTATITTTTTTTMAPSLVAMANATLENLTSAFVHSTKAALTTLAPVTKAPEIRPPDIIGSGSMTAYGYYSCDQWYSWERLVTGHDGGLPHAGSFLIGFAFYVTIAIAFAGLCSAFVFFLAPAAAGSGIPEVKTILGGFEIRNFLEPWTLVVKLAGLPLSVSTGLCIGHDGPMVHVGACCARLLSRLFPKYGRNGAKTRELISAAVAAGIGACFGAPIGGVLFSLEVASFYFPMKTLFRSFFCALAAAYVARVLNPFGEDHFIMFSVDHDTSWHFLELIPFASLGILGGIFGALVIRLNKVVQNMRRNRCQNRPIAYLLMLTAAYSMIAYFHPDLRVHEKLFIRKLVLGCSPGDQEDLCDYIRLPPGGFANLTVMSDTSLEGSFPAGPRMGRGVILLIVALIFKFVGLVLVYGVPVPTGVMLPSIMVGAILGRLMGITVEQAVVAQLPGSPYFSKFCKPGRPCIDPGLYAVVGAAACLGGITRATISLVVIMIELIGGLGHIIPIMVAAMFAKWTGDWLYFGSLYDVQIRLNHYPYLGFDKIVSKVGETKACDIMHPRPGEGPLELLTENTMTVDDVEELIYSSEHNGFPVVESIESRCLVGFVSRWDLVRALDLDRSHDARRYGPTAIVCFTDRAPPAMLTRKRVSTSVLSPEFSDRSNGTGPLLVDVQHIVDLSPTTITQHTHVSTIVDIFRSLGLRQTLITCNGQLRGIITKKDVLRYLDSLQ